MKNYKRLLSFLLPYKGLLFFALVSMVLLALTTGLYLPLIDLLSTSLFRGGEAVGEVVQSPLTRVSEYAAYVGIQFDAAKWQSVLEAHLIWVFAAVVLIKATSQAVRFWTMGAIGQHVVADVRHQLFSAITRQSQGFFGDQATGLLVSRVINDVGHVERAATYAIPVMIGDVLKVIVLAGLCLWQYPKLALVTVVVLPLAAFPIVRFGKLLKRYARDAQESLGLLTNRVTETLGGMRMVQVYGRQSHEVGRFDAESDKYVHTMMRSVAVRAAQTPVMELIGFGALMLTIGYAQTRIEAGDVRPGEVIAFLLGLILMYEPLKAVGRLNGIIMPGLAAAERVFEIVDRPSDVRDAEDATELTQTLETICLEDVTFSYPGAAQPALSSVSLELSKGKKLALVGPSGGGKSTVAALLPRLYDVSEGRIALDGQDVRQFKLQSLRAQMAVVAQETYLFNDTIAANIAYGRPDATRAQIEEAARAAFAHEFIEALPEGYDTVTGERGFQLSGGQRQRVAIARAFLRDAPVLILDEATSALDTESEREVQRALDALMQNRTALIIAHRLSTVRSADEIVVLQGGKVAERGTHAELLEKKGLYADLAEIAREPAVEDARCA